MHFVKSLSQNKEERVALFMGIFAYLQTLLQSGSPGSAMIGLFLRMASSTCVRGTQAKAGMVWKGRRSSCPALLALRLVLDPGQQLGTASSLCHGVARAGRGCREVEGWTPRVPRLKRPQTHRVRPLLEEASQG